MVVISSLFDLDVGRCDRLNDNNFFVFYGKTLAMSDRPNAMGGFI
ncbi:hypothetical protein [Nostoc sp. T09]|nr:hypothetical protein [Nostoc sp. T09]